MFRFASEFDRKTGKTWKFQFKTKLISFSFLLILFRKRLFNCIVNKKFELNCLAICDSVFPCNSFPDTHHEFLLKITCMEEEKLRYLLLKNHLDKKNKETKGASSKKGSKKGLFLNFLNKWSPYINFHKHRWSINE